MENTNHSHSTHTNTHTHTNQTSTSPRPTKKGKRTCHSTPPPPLLSLLLLSASTIAFSNEDCVYTLYIRTGSIIKGGTDSIISVRLYNMNGDYVRVSDIEAWGGLMEPGHDCFERGNLDIFSGRAPCLSSPVCALNLTSDGSGSGHGWYVNYVEVTTTGVHATCSQMKFTIEQWLALDTSPYELTAVRNYCDYYRAKKSAALSSSM